VTQVNYKNGQPLTKEVDNKNCDCVHPITKVHLFVVLDNVPNATQQKANAKHTEIDDKFDL
jgi:hypothetical protein